MKGCLILVGAIIFVPMIFNVASEMGNTAVLTLIVLGVAAFFGRRLFQARGRLAFPRKSSTPAAASTTASGAPAAPTRKEVRAAAKKAREDEQRHAARIHREQNWREQAVGSGTQTGYEPANLAHIPIPTLPQMFGTPGVGAVAAGTPQAAADRIREGLENFARALASQGLLERFAIYWSVHMPSEDGPGPDFGAAVGVDCVIVTGKSVWYVDVKNYAQGGVTWIVDDNQLIAVDKTDGGMVGEARPMGQKGFSDLTNRFSSKFKAIGFKTSIRSRVVLLPRHNGLGDIPPLTWPGDIPIVGLPALLAELNQEPPFNPSARHVDLIHGMLTALQRGSDGQPPKPGQRRMAAAQPSVAVPPAAPAPTAAAQPDAATASSGVGSTPTAAAPPADPTCSSCGATVTADSAAAGFCYECTAELS